MSLPDLFALYKCGTKRERRKQFLPGVAELAKIRAMKSYPVSGAYLSRSHISIPQN
jgi:hypothetical protein